MVLQFIFGIILLVIVVYISLKILQNIAIGIVLIVLVLFASYLILGSIPTLRDIPIVGGYLQNFFEKFLPKIPRTTGEAIGIVKEILYHIEILNVERDSEQNLLITLANTGKLEVSSFKFFVDGNEVKVLNKPKDPLKSKEVTVFQVDWKGNFSNIEIKDIIFYI
ncbi:MAG: hypothetical protein QW140_02730 [Candidatus Aenigmatarchaeota archaeon]